MRILPFLGVLSQTHLWLYKTIYGAEHVGTDALNNSYYRSKPHKSTGRERRWVIYDGVPEASKVPPEWHAWLHYVAHEVPKENNPLRRQWQKPYVPNPTGTEGSYFPPGHVLNKGKRAPATGDYQAWTPPS